MMALMNETTSVHSYIEYALDFANAGLYAEAERLLLLWVNKNDGIVYPMVYYALGYFASKSDDVLKAIDYYKKASQMAPDYCFPNKLEEVLMLQDANRLQPNDSKAWYYLGNFWYGARQHDEAIACWERSVELDDQFPTVCVILHWDITTNATGKKMRWLVLKKRLLSIRTTIAF